MSDGTWQVPLLVGCLKPSIPKTNHPGSNGGATFRDRLEARTLHEPSLHFASLGNRSGLNRSHLESFNRFAETAVTTLLAKGRSAGEANFSDNSRPLSRVQRSMIHALSPRQTEPSSAITTSFSSGEKDSIPGKAAIISNEWRGIRRSGTKVDCFSSQRRIREHMPHSSS